MRPCWKRQRTIAVETERKIRVNDHQYNQTFQYANNYITTSKYNLLTFLPKNLFEQLQRVANAYFIGLLILQLIPAISSLTPITTIVPLVIVLSITAIKDAIDDIQRHRSDNQVNNRKSHVLRDGRIVDERWQNVVVGDIIRMHNNQFVAADLLLLSSSEPNSLCYIETAELDGETNLKVRQAVPDTAEMGEDDDKLQTFDGEIKCEPPNNRLAKFEGVLHWKGNTYALDNDNMLLRGCVLRNTKWCYGVVVFAGKDTKLMMNSGQARFKRTNIDRLMNVLIVGIFIFLASSCLLLTICCGVWESLVGYNFQQYLPWDSYIPGSPSMSGTKEAGSTVIAVMVFLSYVIVLNTVVPISLYVSVEMIRVGHSLWINWDQKMYYEPKDTPAKARTTTLNEELGQIEYIFSDKTGTLTQNIMTFKKCSINGKSFGDPQDKHGNKLEITMRTPKADFSWNSMCEPTFDFYDQRLINDIRGGDEQCCEFFRLLALCHTVMPEEKEGKLEYQAQSPDEGALVSAARNFGYVFRSRTPTTITIEVNGVEETYELLCILDFNNVRKRMSVIVKKDGRITLYCKGADSMIYERLNQQSRDLKELTSSHLNEFAQDGLRTLCLSVKHIDSNYFDQWKQKHFEASTSMEDRDDKLDAVYEEIEQEMTLLGATAIEDKLQDGVPETIANLAVAGIKIWVLTGDKVETAINIGYSCRLLTDDMDMFQIDGETYEEVETQLTNARDEMKKTVAELTSNGTTNVNGPTSQHTVDVVSFSDGNHSPMPDGPITAAEFGGFALIITGQSLVHALNHKLEMLLLETGCMCKAVICCRVTPLQKAMVVDLVKRNKQSITLAIGDGANDVSMIKTAHIGVGISGQEGMQAVLSSDYSMAQFRYLERLLLVHGRWSYLRMCSFLKYFFYKNFAFTLCHFWFAFFCGFSAQIVYDQYFIALYNVCYTSLPVICFALFDQDVNEDYCLRYPKLYTPGLKNILFNKKKFGWSVFEGILSSIVLFFIPYGAFVNSVRADGRDMIDHQSFGVTVASILIIAVNLRCALDTYYWTGFNHFFIWGSIIFYFLVTFIFYMDSIGYAYVGVARSVMATGTFWFTLILTVTILLIPVIAIRFFYIDTQPTLTDRVRLKQKISKSKSKSEGLILRRHSTLRRSQRSLRSGYAFAHTEGFGNLITSGRNMRDNSRPNTAATRVTSARAE